MFGEMAYALGRDRSMCKKVLLVQGYIPLFWMIAMQKGVFVYIPFIFWPSKWEENKYYIQTKIYLNDGNLKSVSNENQRKLLFSLIDKNS